MRSQEYKDFSLRIHENGQHTPLVTQFEITHRCNVRCRHCYIVRDPSKEELKTKDACRILDVLANEGCLWLCLTGGEPLVREDFLDIYSYAFKKGFVITLFTNATLFSEEIATCLKKFPPFCIEVTLNGATKKTYELISGVPGSFEKAMEGIERIRAHGLPLKIKTQALTLNIGELRALAMFCKERNMKFICDASIIPRLDGSTEPCRYRLPIQSMIDIANTRNTATIPEESPCTGVKRENKEEERVPPLSDKLFLCPGGKWMFYIDPYGHLFFCNTIRKPSYDLLSLPLKESAAKLFSEIDNRRFTTDSKCRTCEHRHYCLNCPGKAQLEVKDPEAPVTFYCEHIKLKRAKEKEWRMKQQAVPER
jgi:radical SAM protein with 4Fe4S-binding SPASM domain